MKKRILAAVLCLCMALTLLPVTAAAEETAESGEQFSLEPGKGYYYFYIEEWDRYVLFDYAGTVDAYVLNSRSRGKTDAAAEASEHTENTGTWYGYTYTHSLFIARNLHFTGESWDALNEQGWIFGKTFESNGVKYTMRAPTVGSAYRELEEGWKVTPANNEWDAILNKGFTIQSASNYSSWGQDTTEYDRSYRAARGGGSAQTRAERSQWRWERYASGETEAEKLRYRPVLEVMNADELGRDGLKVVTLDMNGGKLRPGSVDRPKIIVRGGTESFTAPTTAAIGRPRGNTSSYFKWLGNDGVLYEPGGEVPATVTELTAQWNVAEQFSLEPGGTYYFDLSGTNLYSSSEMRRGKVYDALPDKTLHYVPFTYAGTVDTYVLNSNSQHVKAAATEAAATRDNTGQYGYTYNHSLFIANYILKNRVSWKELSSRGWIFGKKYTSNGVVYTMRAPTAGSSGDAENSVTPGNNEWDVIADKNSKYIKNWEDVVSWGQDSVNVDRDPRMNKAVRGLRDLRRWRSMSQGTRYGYRPVLEVRNADALGYEALQVVTLQLEESSVGGSNSIRIIVRGGRTFKAPSCEGLVVAEGYDRASFRWKDSSGNLYAPGDSVPAGVTELRAQWSAPEQFSLEPGGTYYFNLAAVEGSRYQAFTYVGTVGAYRTVEDSSGSKYSGNDPHTLFVSESATKWGISWDSLNGQGLIYGKAYENNGVDYTMRAPTGGTGRGAVGATPENNEWDRILDKGDYIKGAHRSGAWCQDQLDVFRNSFTLRGDDGWGVRRFDRGMSAHSFGYYIYRPVLEVMNAGALGQDGLKAVTLQLNGGKVNDREQIQIIVRNGQPFAAPVRQDIGKPEGKDYKDEDFRWLGNDGVLYAPGDEVPATVDTLTAQWEETEYFVVTYQPGELAAEKTPQSDIKEPGQALTLRGALFTREDYEQTGWATSDGGEKMYELGGSYTEEASVTLYPVWTPVHEHTYGGWKWDETHHWHECTDEDCPEKDKGKKDEAEHQFGEWTVTKEATETEKGEKARSCRTEGCEYVDTQEIPATGDDKPVQPHEHKYAWRSDHPALHWQWCTDENCPDEENRGEKDLGVHVYVLEDGKVIKEPTETDWGTMEVECTVCGYIREWEIPPVTPHEHTYDGKWSADEMEHWRACADPDCPREDRGEQDRAEHQFGDWTVTREATALEPGEETRACAVCGYSETQATPTMHIHLYPDKWSMDAQQHWKECADENCADRLGSMTNIGAHEYETEPDESGDTPVYRCSVCGYGKAQGPEEPGGTEGHECEFVYASDAKRHWLECGDENCPDRLESMGDPEAHRFGEWKVTVQPTEETTGWKEQLCGICEYSRKREIPVIEPGDPGDDDGPGGDDEPGGGGGRYYYSSSTDGGGENTAPEKVSAPKTADAGVAVYALSGMLGLGGLAFTGRKRRK